MVACVFDATLMLLLTDDLAVAPPAPYVTDATDQRHVADDARARLTFLIETLDDERADIILPTPVLTELLASARTDVAGTLAILNGIARIRIEGFGQRAAIECAELLRRTGRGAGPKSKVKFDHQIVAIAKVVGADLVYSNDKDIRAMCAREAIECRGVWDLPSRPADPQSSLPL